MKLATFTIKIDGPQMTRAEVAQFMKEVDLDGQITDQLLGVVRDHIFEHAEDAELVKIVVERS